MIDPKETAEVILQLAELGITLPPPTVHVEKMDKIIDLMGDIRDMLQDIRTYVRN